MSDSNMRFDPYTGDPIPNDTPADQMNNNATNSNPYGDGMQQTGGDSSTSPVSLTKPSDTNPEFSQPTVENTINTQAASDSHVYPQQPVNDSYQSSPDNMYHMPAPDSNTNYNNANYNNSTNQQSNDQQYNPYTGQPMNNNTAQPNDADKKDNNANIFSGVSLGCGIASIVFSMLAMCCCPFLSIILAIAAIIFGVLAKNSMGLRNGLAKAGIITAICGIVLTIIMTIVGLALVSSSDSFINQIKNEIEQDSNYNYNSDHNSNFNFDDYNTDTYENDDFY